MDAWNSLCLPAKIYILVMIPIILFDIYLGSTKYAISNSISLFIGAILLWTLCAAKLEFVAYVLMILPVLFFVFLIALIFYDKSMISVRHEYIKARLKKQQREQIEANQYENDIKFNDNQQCEENTTQCGNPQCGNPQCGNPQCSNAQPSAPKTCSA